MWYSSWGTEQLFDLADDPHELHNLASDPHYESALKKARGYLIAELEGREEGFVDEGDLVTGRPVHAVLTQPHPPLDEGR